MLVPVLPDGSVASKNSKVPQESSVDDACSERAAQKSNSVQIRAVSDVIIDAGARDNCSRFIAQRLPLDQDNGSDPLRQTSGEERIGGVERG
jgi:hypothetical protein